MNRLAVITIGVTTAISVYMIFGPTYTGGGSAVEYKHMSAIEVNGPTALVFLIPVCVALLGLVPALGTFPGVLMFILGFISFGWPYIGIALLMLIPSNWQTASLTTRITSVFGISLIVGLVIISVLNWKLHFMPVSTRKVTLQDTGRHVRQPSVSNHVPKRP